MSTKNHNLNIHMYNFQELLDLFNLQHNFSLDELKQAKKVVIRTHPDKSKLSGDYFLFYKKAFEIIVKYYENNHKQNAVVPDKKINYESNNSHFDEETDKQVSKMINNMDAKDFNQKFNTIFDKEMVSTIDTEKNKWFQEEDPQYKTNEKVNANNIGDVFNKMKSQQQGIVKYKGVQNLFINSNSGTQLYDEEDSDEYITTDPFGKLKFEDLRKVHKDQTIFAVSENDIHKVKQYNSVEQYNRERGRQVLTPLKKQEAERQLQTQELDQQKKISQKEYQSKLQTMNYTEKNKNVLSTFLRIKN